MAVTPEQKVFNHICFTILENILWIINNLLQSYHIGMTFHSMSVYSLVVPYRNDISLYVCVFTRCTI